MDFQNKMEILPVHGKYKNQTLATQVSSFLSSRTNQPLNLYSISHSNSLDFE